MPSLLKSRFQKMLGVQFLGSIVTLIDRYGSVPILTYYWGLPLFGEWLLIRIIPTYLSMFEAGFPSAAGNKIVLLMSEGKEQEAANLYAVTSKIITMISVVILGSTTLALLLGDPKAWLNIQTLSTETVIITVLLSCLNTVFIFRTQLLYALYRSHHQQVYWSSIIQFTHFIEFVMVVLVAVCGGGVIALSAAIALVRLGAAVFLTFKARTKIPLDRIMANDTSLGLSKQLLGAGFGFMLMPLTQALNIQGFVWLISYVLSPSMAAIFNIYRVYSRAIFQIGSIIGRSLWPELTAKYADQDVRGFGQLLLKSILSIIFIGIVTALISYHAADYIIPLWTVGKVENDPNIIGLLLIVSFFGAIRYVTLTAAMATNQHTYLMIFEVIVNITSLIFLYSINQINFLSISFSLIMIELIVSSIVFGKVISIVKKMAK